MFGIKREMMRQGEEEPEQNEVETEVNSRSSTPDPEGFFEQDGNEGEPVFEGNVEQEQEGDDGGNPNILQNIIFEATQFTAEIKRLKTELVISDQMLVDKDRELEETKETLNEQSEEILRLQGLLEESRGCNGREEVKDLREMKLLVANERKLRFELEQKFRVLSEGTVAFLAGFNKVMNDLKTPGEFVRRASTAQDWDRVTEKLLQKLEDCEKNQNSLKRKFERISKNVEVVAEIVEKAKNEEVMMIDLTGEEDFEAPVIIRQQSLAPENTTRPGHAEDLGKIGIGFFCICGAEYSRRSNLRIHVKTFTEKGNFMCDSCGQNFVLYYMLRRHLKDKHGVVTPKGKRNIGCADCGLIFTNYMLLHEHRKIAHIYGSIPSSDPTATAAPTFPKVIGSGQQLENFGLRSSQSSDVLQASIGISSGKSYPTKRHYQDLTKRHLGFHCSCGVQFVSQKMLDGHLQLGNQSATGPEEDSRKEQQVVSSKSKSVSGRVAQNLRKSHGINPNNELECICGYQTNNKFNFSKHITYHTLERQFKCTVCGQAFINTAYLKQHLKRRHKHANVDMDKIRMGCSKCGQTFSTRRLFHEHNMSIHYGVNNFFGNSRKLLKRSQAIGGKSVRGQFDNGRVAGKVKVEAAKNVEEVKKKFSCTRCPNKFEALHQLILHKRHVHKIRQDSFQIGCKDCGLSFATRQQHVRHRMTVHNNKFGRRPKLAKSGGKFGKSEPKSENLGGGAGAKVVIPLMPANEQPSTSAAAFSDPMPVSIPWVDEALDDFDDDELEFETAADLENDDRKDPDYKAPSSLHFIPFPKASTPNTGTSPKNGANPPKNPQVNQNHAVKGFQEGIGHFCVCGNIFNERKNLFSHIRRLTQSWKFHCDICHKSFFYNAALKRHKLLTHKIKNVYSSRQKKQLGCVICGKTFPSWNTLRKHRSEEHLEDDQKFMENVEPEDNRALGFEPLVAGQMDDDQIGRDPLANEDEEEGIPETETSALQELQVIMHGVDT